tara:strand:+ start:1000 stop:2679 length:1680 start_codon:yes stop_codon:yes gene_type:complete
MQLKIFLIIVLLLYQTVAYSKASDKNDFNPRYLSNYFSALLSYDNQKNKDALKYFENSKVLIKQHDNFLREYVFSLVLDGQVSKAIKEVKFSKSQNNSNFFEANLLMVLDSIKKKNFKQASLKLQKLEIVSQRETYQLIIIKTLEDYNNLFRYKKIQDNNNNFGKLDMISEAFQNCYVGSLKTNSYFLNLINSPEGDYSRYLFFYLGNLLENSEFKSAKEISETIDPLRNSLLITQAKNWLDNENYKRFKEYFSCKNENDLLAEFFFLISNLYSSQDRLEDSNFYLNISNYLNAKFYFNLSLIAENYFSKENFKLTKTILNKFSEKDEIYRWYKIKKLAQIYGEEGNVEKSLNYLNIKVKEFKKPSIKILYDIANIYKNFKNYKKAIDYYSEVLSRLDENSLAYADILYRRGGSFERIGEYKKSDRDLLRSLEIRPDDPYTLNYLAYGWLERDYKIGEAIEMLNKAYDQKKNDPYISDSVGWGYFLIGDYINAEKYLKRAVELLPDDPIAGDHYGDVLWKLNRKIQAKYFWENALKSEEADEKMKEIIKIKLLYGLENI